MKNRGLARLFVLGWVAWIVFRSLSTFWWGTHQMHSVESFFLELLLVPPFIMSGVWWVVRGFQRDAKP